MRTSKNALFAAFLFCAILFAHAGNAQRRVITNDDIPPAPTAPVQPVQAAQSPAQTSGEPDATEASVDTPAADAKAAAHEEINRLTALQSAMRDASDIFFDKIREGTAAQPVINKWNQVRDNLTLAIDELDVFIAEARRSLPLDVPPATPPASPAQIQR
jgi:hypothetical protein